MEFNQDGDLLATGDKGGRVVIFQRDPAVRLFPTLKRKQIKSLFKIPPKIVFLFLRGKVVGSINILLVYYFASFSE